MRTMSADISGRIVRTYNYLVAAYYKCRSCAQVDKVRIFTAETTRREREKKVEVATA
jgi:hypothetical protein